MREDPQAVIIYRNRMEKSVDGMINDNPEYILYFGAAAAVVILGFVAFEKLRWPVSRWLRNRNSIRR